MQIHITKSQRKTLSMRFDTQGALRVRAPFFMTQQQIDLFLQKHKIWIEKHHNISQQKILSSSQIEDLKQKAHKFIPPRVKYFAETFGFEYTKIRISSAQTRWGSCSSRGTLSFSYRLMQYREECIDYVIVHELCHLREMNHSPKFWAEVAAIMPDYKKWEQILKGKK